MKILLTIIVFLGLKVKELLYLPIWLIKKWWNNLEFEAFKEYWDTENYYDTDASFKSQYKTLLLLLLPIFIAISCFIVKVYSKTMGWDDYFMIIILGFIAIFAVPLVILLVVVLLIMLFITIANFIKDNWKKATEIVERKLK